MVAAALAAWSAGSVRGGSDGGAPARDERPADAAGQPADRAVRERLGVERFRVERVRVEPAEDAGVGAVRVGVRLDGMARALVLRPHSLRAPGFEVRAAGVGIAEVPALTTYRGHVEGVPGSEVVASVIGEEVTASVYVHGEPRWHVQPITDAGVAGAPGEHVVYAHADASLPAGVCGTGLLAKLPPGGGGGEGGARGRANCARIAEIAFDCDYEYFVANGSSIGATVADTEMVLNEVDYIFTRDTNVSFQVTLVNVWFFPDDPYTTTDAGGRLDQFRAAWTSGFGSVRRDLAHLMTGVDLDGGIIGVAWVGTVCWGAYHYGLSQTLIGSIVARAGLTAHEVGHNFNAGHCDGDADCYIMCSGLGGCAGDLTRFGSRSRAAITAFRDGAACLSAGPEQPPAAADDGGATLEGGSVVVDVLGNDTDANCQAIVIASFDAVSAAGGAVTRSVGTGPGGRDELRYEAPGGFFGVDSFAYTAEDDTGRSSTATVRVEVFDLREPDQPSWTEPGVGVDYYALAGGVASLPDFDELTPYAGDVLETIDVPATNGAFATSGRANNVGAVFTGYVSVPEPGLYTFYTTSDDGSALHVGDRLVVDNDGLHGMVERGGSIGLAAGLHAVRVEFFEGGGACGLIVGIEGGGLGKQTIPASMWRRFVCRADLNGDGALNSLDVLVYLALFGYADPLADFDGNGTVDTLDFLAFLNAFNAGC